jgi:hypothetical protein
MELNMRIACLFDYVATLEQNNFCTSSIARHWQVQLLIKASSDAETTADEEAPHARGNTAFRNATIRHEEVLIPK